MEMQVKPVLGAPSQGESDGRIAFPADCCRCILSPMRGRARPSSSNKQFAMPREAPMS